jgi:hypothetical protein
MMGKIKQRDILYLCAYGVSVLMVAFLLSAEHHDTSSNMG